MGPLTAAGLGAVQGVTEFLPVSSSGHLVLAQSLVRDFRQPGVLFDVLLHVGTLASILAYLVCHGEFMRGVLEEWRRWVGVVLIGTLPAAAAGLTLRDEITSLFLTVAPVGAALMVTGTVLFLSETLRRGGERRQVSGLDALLIGAAQAAALVPGISRSGATIATGLLLGLGRDTATLFSLLLALPATGGAGLVELVAAGMRGVSEPWYSYCLGVATSALVGYVAVGWIFRVVRARYLRAFGTYCWMAGLAAVVATWGRGGALW